MSALFLAFSPIKLAAQTVSVQNGYGDYGFGWMFGRNDACYIIMPKHVAGPFPRVTIRTAAPVLSSNATVIAPFWPGVDLALGVARGELTGRCTAELDDLRLGSQEMSSHTADLLRLSPNGEVSRMLIKVQDTTYLDFTGTIADGSQEISQGTSGAFAFIKGRPIGMAITSDDPVRARFMRAGEILINVRRFLEEQGGAYTPPQDYTTKAQTDAPNALPLAFVSSSMPPVNPMFAPENVLGDGPFVFAPSRTMRLVLGFEEITQVSRLVVKSTAKEGQTIPKSVLLRISIHPNGYRFSNWARMEMGPDGVLDTGIMAPRNARHIEIRIFDSWSTGDIAIDNVAAF